jgi:hypothetical protein
MNIGQWLRYKIKDCYIAVEYGVSAREGCCGGLFSFAAKFV